MLIDWPNFFLASSNACSKLERASGELNSKTKLLSAEAVVNSSFVGKKVMLKAKDCFSDSSLCMDASRSFMASSKDWVQWNWLRNFRKRRWRKQRSDFTGGKRKCFFLHVWVCYTWWGKLTVSDNLLIWAKVLRSSSNRLIIFWMLSLFDAWMEPGAKIKRKAVEDAKILRKK